MPLHLDSITNNSQDTKLLAWILQNGTQECDSAFATPDKRYIHMKRGITDHSSDELIGELVFTLKNTGKQLEILDLDIILINDRTSKIRFLKIRDNSSDSNEYYDIETVDEGSHLIIETVNRHTEPKKLISTERDVHISMFPFQVNLYDSMEAFNQWAGFSKPIEAGESGFFVHGFSERFCMPGSVTGTQKCDDDYSFVIGRVKSIRDVSIDFGETNLPFVIAEIDTALGVVPVAMGRDVFDLEKLKAGCIAAMNTVVKADISAPDSYKI